MCPSHFTFVHVCVFSEISELYGTVMIVSDLFSHVMSKCFCDCCGRFLEVFHMLDPRVLVA